MLKDDFYTVTGSVTDSENAFSTSISLNADHSIFEGHFPGLPVVPGVCMMAIVKELLSEKLNRALILQKSFNMKFLSLINPLENSNVDVHIRFQPGENNEVTADASITSGDTVFFKLVKATYR